MILIPKTLTLNSKVHHLIHDLWMSIDLFHLKEFLFNGHNDQVLNSFAQFNQLIHLYVILLSLINYLFS